MMALIPITDEGVNADGRGYYAIYKLFDPETTLGPLWRMNDNGIPFAKIADYIEEHL